MRNRSFFPGFSQPALRAVGLLLLLSGLLFPPSLSAAPQLATTPPKDIQGMIDKAVAADPDVDPQGLRALIELLDLHRTRQALIWHKGKVIAEWYDYGTNENTVMECWSLTKSFGSTGIGLLIDEGKIKSIDDPVSKYIPSWSEGLKSQVTIAHLLEHTSGLKDVAGATAPPDLLQKCIDAEIINAPGAVKQYNNAGCNVLSAIIMKASGQDTEEYLRAKIFKPLGMNNTSMRRDEGGNVLTYAGLQSTPRDLLKFGQLFLNKGEWEGKRLISREWIELATAPRSQLTIGFTSQTSKYGLLWWVYEDKEKGVPLNYNALGLWGNNLSVIPESELIGVRLVGNASDGGKLMNVTADWVNALAHVIKAATPPAAALAKGSAE